MTVSERTMMRRRYEQSWFVIISSHMMGRESCILVLLRIHHVWSDSWTEPSIFKSPRHRSSSTPSTRVNWWQCTTVRIIPCWKGKVTKHFKVCWMVCCFNRLLRNDLEQVHSWTWKALSDYKVLWNLIFRLEVEVVEAAVLWNNFLLYIYQVLVKIKRSRARCWCFHCD